MGAFIDLTGNKYGKLKVVERSTTSKWGQATWRCQCECGNETFTDSGSLKKGNTKSCGCIQKSSTSQRSTTHGLSNLSEYKIWIGMKQRCFNGSNKSYSHYGGRGISVSESWTNSFDSFYKDMGNRPSIEYSLERIDNDGNYELGNCKWATKTEQACNQRKKKSNSTGHVGVGWREEARKWTAGIRVNNKKIHLGYYSEINKAVEARMIAEIKYWGRSS